MSVSATQADGPDSSVSLGDTTVATRRVLLCTGLVDVLPDLPGLAEVWRASVFQRPYCHGWEVTDAQREHRRAAGLSLEERRAERLVLRAGPDGVSPEAPHSAWLTAPRCLARVLFYHPPPHQASLRTRLELALNDNGFVVVDAMGQTSLPGIYAAGDLTTMMQSATIAAARRLSCGRNDEP